MINECGVGDRYFIQGHCAVNGLYTPFNPIALNTWYHLVATINGTQEKVYVHGMLVSSGNNFNTPTHVSSRDLSFGVDVSPSGYAPYVDGCTGWFNGKIDDIRIYNRPLTPSEVLQLYHEGVNNLLY